MKIDYKPVSSQLFRYKLDYIIRGGWDCNSVSYYEFHFTVLVQFPLHTRVGGFAGLPRGAKVRPLYILVKNKETSM